MYDVIILGAGLAGLALASSLLEQGLDAQKLLVLDASGVASGASGATGAMLHPLPGRWLELQVGYPQAWSEASAWYLQKLRRFETQDTATESATTPATESATTPATESATTPATTPTAMPASTPGKCAPLGFQAPMLRPLLEGEEGQEMLEAWRAQRWRALEGLESHFVPKDEALERWPWLQQSQGVIVFSPGLTLRMGDFTKALAADLRGQGFQGAWPVEARALQRRPDGSWLLRTSQGDLHTKAVAFALGGAMRPWFPALPWQMTGGEVVRVELPVEDIGMTERVMISSAGYLAPLPEAENTGEIEGDGRKEAHVSESRGTEQSQGRSKTEGGRMWIVGATFWKEQGPLSRSASAVWSDLREKASRLIPAFENARPCEAWFGTRCTYQTDSRPLVGPIPGMAGLFLFTAFASRGLFWIPWLAKSLASAIITGKMRGSSETSAFLPSRITSSRLWKLDPRFFSL